MRTRNTKGEAAFRNMFILISILLFAFFIFDLAMSYVSVCQAGVQMQCELVPVIDLIPLL